MEDAIKTKLQEANAILDPDLFQPKATSIPIAVIPENEVESEVEVENEADAKTEATSKEIKSKEKKKKKDKKKKKKKSKDKKIAAEKVETVTAETDETPEETLELGKPLSFDKKEKHSFSQWLQLTNFKPIDRSNEVENEVKIEPKAPIEAEKKVENTPEVIAEIEVSEEEKQKRFELIDKFIDTNPKIKPKPTLEKTINLANDTSVDQSMLMTETLAKVYLEQKKYRKAIKAYDILILKYPEKSGFFADQIRAIKKLQQNN